MEKYLNVSKCRKEFYSLNFQFLKRIDSTSDYLKRELRVNNNVTDGVAVAQVQTQGRGTKGRSWVDSPEHCLKFSFIKKLDKEIENPLILSPWIALNLQKALSGMGIKELKVKWPNDLIINNGKVAGVLLEMIHKNSSWFLIIGVGINLFYEEKIKEVTKRDIGFLFGTEQPSVDMRTKALLALVGAINSALHDIPAYFSEDLIRCWNECNYRFGEKIFFRGPANQMIEGINDGIDSNGKLIIRSSDQIARSYQVDGEIF